MPTESAREAIARFRFEVCRLSAKSVPGFAVKSVPPLGMIASQDRKGLGGEAGGVGCGQVDNDSVYGCAG